MNAQPETGADLARLATQPWLTSAEAALYLRLPSVNALRCRMVKGSIPDWCWSRLGRSLRFNRRALDELMAGNATDARTMRALARR